jgi:hypothetical protein
MTEAEILATLDANDKRAIRALIEFIQGGTSFDYIDAIKKEQDALREQLRQLRGE